MTTRSSIIWHDPAETQYDSLFSQQIGGHPLVAQILAQRGFVTIDAARAFLHPRHYRPTPPNALPDLIIAAEHLSKAIDTGRSILVWGDFDVDGQTATALLVDALQRLGANVNYYIPNRLRESHGIRLDSLQQQIEFYAPSILLTCDTGISALVAIDYAKSWNIITLVTDHHDLPAELPTADAVVNPKRLPNNHPLASLPGVGVAYKLVEHLYTSGGRSGELTDFLDLAALGIVADVAQQTQDTRYLLQVGLEQLQQSRRLGIQALIEVAALSPQHLTATDIGFQLGPRLNAAGRLDDARPVVELLTTKDSTRARLLAAQLEGLNTQRRLQNRQIYAAAQEQIARDPSLLDWEALVLSHPSWHPGIIGIVAGQLAEYYHRPVILLNTNEAGLARGSARSVPGYDIGAAIAAQSDLLIEYGGHPGAAGLSLPVDHILAFRRRLSDTLQEIRDPSVRPGLQLDAVLALNDINLDLAAEINRLAPFGEGNPRVTFATRDLHLKSAAYLGRSQQHRRLTVEDANGNRQMVLWWNCGDQPLPGDLFDLAYELDTRIVDGNPELQLTLVNFRRAVSAPPEVIQPSHEIVDYRVVNKAPQDIIAQYPDAAVWAEGYRRADSPGVPLSELSEANELIVYTTPAGPQMLQNALERVKPHCVVLVAVNPPLQTLSDVLRRLMELVKYVLNQQHGETTLIALAEAIGQTSTTIQLAMDYSAALGEIDVILQDENLILKKGSGISSPDASEQLAILQASFNETAAYRAYFCHADPHRLLGWINEP